MSELTAEDAKIVTLARSTRARTGGEQGAAVRDEMGRTYAASTVSLAGLQLTAIQAAVAAAVSSGSTRFEAVAVVGGGQPTQEDRALLAEVGSPALIVADLDGQPRP